MATLEQKIDLIMEYIVTDDEKLKGYLKKDIAALLHTPTENPPAAADLEDLVIDLLKEIGIAPHNNGYKYLICAVQLCIENADYLNHISFGLYPEVAKRFDTSATCVERGIRHSIKMVFEGYYGSEAAYKFVGNTVSSNTGKPTNSQFICLCVQEIKRRMRQCG